MNMSRAMLLLFVPATLLSGCAKGPPQSEADLQQRLTAAETRADAAEKRAKNAEAIAAQHAQEARQQLPPGAPPEIAQVDNEIGQPMNDTAPIEPVPAMPAQGSQ